MEEQGLTNSGSNEIIDFLKVWQVSNLGLIPDLTVESQVRNQTQIRHLSNVKEVNDLIAATVS